MNRSSFLRSNTYVRTMNELDLTTVAERSDEAMEGMYFDNIFKIFLLGSIQSDWTTTDEFRCDDVYIILRAIITRR